MLESVVPETGKEGHPGRTTHDDRRCKGQYQTQPRCLGPTPVCEPEHDRSQAVKNGDQPAWPLEIEHGSETLVHDTDIEQDSHYDVAHRQPSEEADENPAADAVGPRPDRAA